MIQIKIRTLIFAQRDKEKVDVKISKNRYINRLINDLIRFSEILSNRTWSKENQKKKFLYLRG